MSILVVAEHADGALLPSVLNTVTAAGEVAGHAGSEVHLLVAGSSCGAVAEHAARGRQVLLGRQQVGVIRGQDPLQRLVHVLLERLRPHQVPELLAKPTRKSLVHLAQLLVRQQPLVQARQLAVRLFLSKLLHPLDRKLRHERKHGSGNRDRIERHSGSQHPTGGLGARQASALQRRVSRPQGPAGGIPGSPSSSPSRSSKRYSSMLVASTGT